MNERVLRGSVAASQMQADRILKSEDEAEAGKRVQKGRHNDTKIVKENKCESPAE